MIASALVALAVLAGYNQSSTQRAMRRQLDARVADAATISTAYMATHIQTLSTNLEYYATRPNLIDLVRSGAARRGELTSLLSSLRLDVLAVAAVSVLDPSGHVVATTGGSQFVGVDESQQDYFRGALRAGKTYLSSAYSSTPTSSRLLANVITPIPGATSTGSAGYLTAAVPLDQLQALVVQFAQQSGLGVAVTDQNGVTTASSLGQQLGRIDPANRSWLDSALRGKDGMTTIDSPGGRLVLSYQHLPGAWVIAVWLPESTVVTPLNKLRDATLLLTVALAIAVVVSGVLLYRVNHARDRALRQLRDADERRRIAREMNDTIVQDLVAAEASYDLGETDHSRTLLRSASRRARQWVGHLLTEDEPVRPGAARLSGTEPPPPPTDDVRQ